jgi:hypothetical protein
MPGADPNALLNKAYDAGRSATADPQAGTDRRGTIRTLGIIQIVFGGLCVLVALAGIGLAAKAHAPPVASIFYGLAAANLLTTGIGSLRIAPWARRATLISAWIWLCIMVLGVAAMVFGFLLSRSMSMGRGELTMAAVVAVPFLVLALGLPILLIVQFTRPAVRATFEARRSQTS